MSRRFGKSKMPPSATSCGCRRTIGLPVVTDGEFRRENWYADFIKKLSGVVIAAGSGQGFAEHDGTPKHIPKRVQTTGKVSAPHPIVLEDYQFLAATTSRAAKVTIPSPTRLHFHGGRHAVSKAAYPDIEEFFADVAAVYRAEIAALEKAGCRYIQIDDPLLSYFLSPALRQEIVDEGEDPDSRLNRYVRLVNDCIRESRPRDDNRNSYLPRQCAEFLDCARRL